MFLEDDTEEGKEECENEGDDIFCGPGDGFRGHVHYKCLSILSIQPLPLLGAGKHRWTSSFLSYHLPFSSSLPFRITLYTPFAVFSFAASSNGPFGFDSRLLSCSLLASAVFSPAGRWPCLLTSVAGGSAPWDLFWRVGEGDWRPGFGADIFCLERKERERFGGMCLCRGQQVYWQWDCERFGLNETVRVGKEGVPMLTHIVEMGRGEVEGILKVF